MAREEVPAGAAPIVEGERGDRFYVVLSGLFAVSSYGGLGARSVLRPGDYFGEVALTMEIPRTASVRALSPAVVASCDRAEFNEFRRPLVADDAYPASARTESDRRGHASSAQSPNSRSVKQAQASAASGSTQRKVPEPPKCPKVRGELRAPVQCGCFA